MDEFISDVIRAVSSQTIINLFVVAIMISVSLLILKQVNRFVTKLVDIVNNQETVNKRLSDSIANLNNSISSLEKMIKETYVSKEECATTRGGISSTKKKRKPKVSV